MSNCWTVANAFEYLEQVRNTNPTTNVTFQHVGDTMRVIVAGADVTNKVEAPDPTLEEHCPHCGSFPCDLVDGLDDCLEDEGNSLAAAGSCPWHICFCFHHLSHVVLDGSGDHCKLPNSMKAFVKAKFPNMELNKACIGHCEAEEQEAICAKNYGSLWT